MSVNVILVDKTGSLKSVAVKEFNETELFKKAGFKKPDGFEKQTEWNVKLKDNRYLVSLFAKSEGRANTENKYDFPPPIDTTLFFGTCVIVCREKESKHDQSQSVLCDLSVELWEKIYEKLFGGFEDLTLTCVEDENEEDELANVPAEKKTKNGYLKDGFVVDSDDDYDDDADMDDSSSEFDDDEDDESGSGENLDDTNTTNTNTNTTSNTSEDESDAELEEEDYEY